MVQFRNLVDRFPPQNALVPVNQLRRDRMPAAPLKDFATMTSSAAAKGKWAAHKGFAKRATRGSHMPAAHDPQSSFTAARLIRGFLEHLLLLQPYRSAPQSLSSVTDKTNYDL